ncbi:MFS transporter [Nocardia yamanashiensis]|uniref:MFS transporter n=1 Tax=Nocardia yamanashiensis TaxID=209247 RepID=UPI00082E5456|nr:MFS transporter [Nocardia yamanashiensis]
MESSAIHDRRWAILGVLVFSLLVVVMDNTILNVALRTIQADLPATQGQMQWAVDSYALVFAALLILSGVLGDRLGRRRMLLIGLAAFGLASVLCAFARTPLELILCRGLLGAGAAAVQPQTLSIIQNVFSSSERAKAVGIWAGVSGMAIALGPIAGGVLLKYFWWGSVFLVNIPVVIVGFVLTRLLVPESRDPRDGGFDPLGIALSSASMALVIHGIIEGGNSAEWLRWQSLGTIGLGLLLAALFVRHERHAANPMIDLAMFGHRHFAAGVGAIAVVFFALMGATFYLSYFLQAVRGYTALATGVALIAVAAGVMIMSTQSPRLSRRWGANIVAGSGMTVLAAAMLSFTLATATMPQWVLEFQMALIGIGLGMTMTPATEAIMSTVSADRAGAGSAVNNTMRQLAGALGVAVLGSLLTMGFQSRFGEERPAELAVALDRPAAILNLPENARVAPQLRPDSHESISGALEFAQRSVVALRHREQLAADQLPESVVDQHRRVAETELRDYVDAADTAFVHGMRMCALVGGLSGLAGAGLAFWLLPRRRRAADETAITAGESARTGLPKADVSMANER